MTQTTQYSEIEQQIVDAVRALAGVCDYAMSEDNQGFNGVDTHFGHDIAEKSHSYHLSIAQLKSTCKMLQKYRKQIERMGLTLPTNAELAAEQALTPAQLAQRVIAQMADAIDFAASNAARLLAEYDVAHAQQRDGQSLKNAVAHYGNKYVQTLNLTIAEKQEFAVVYARAFYKEYKTRHELLQLQPVA